MNDALNTFYLQLYGVRHMVKDHSDSEKGNPLPPHRLLSSISSKGSFISTIPQQVAHTFVTPVVEHWLEREIAQWVHPMKDRSDDPSHHERTLLPLSYISLPTIESQARHTRHTRPHLPRRSRCWSGPCCTRCSRSSVDRGVVASQCSCFLSTTTTTHEITRKINNLSNTKEGRVFYLMMHSTHFIYSYLASGI